MPNSFNISVKPEIAAAVVKINAIKADTGPIRNDVTSLHDIYLPAVMVDTGAIRNDVTAIHDTMLPSVMIDTGAIRNDMTDVHDTYLPAIKTDTGAIRNDVDDVKAIANSIKLKTDLIPQNFRGLIQISRIETASASFVDVCNITGHGKLYMLGAYPYADGQECNVKLTVDGSTYATLVITDLTKYCIYTSIFNVNSATVQLKSMVPPASDKEPYINLEFKTALRIQVCNTSVSPQSIYCKAVYALD